MDFRLVMNIRTRKKHLLTQVLFSVIFASGELYCFAVISAFGG